MFRKNLCNWSLVHRLLSVIPFKNPYRHFYHYHADKLANNSRIGMMYKTWEKVQDRQAILDQAEKYLGELDENPIQSSRISS